MINRGLGEEKISNWKGTNCFSLGWFCGTASSLAKLGLRSKSGPFDWFFSDYLGVLKQIENGFTDFMNIENLKVDMQKEKTFIDVKYGFSCNHDIKIEFYTEYDEIQERYLRRANNFINAIKKPTVFFRTIRDHEEIDFINKNWQYARDLLKSYNSKNRIVYVFHKGLKGLTNEVEAYSLDIYEYLGKTYEMRHMFDTSTDLLKLCVNLIDIKLMEKNIDFDKSRIAQKASVAYVNKCVENGVEGVDVSIINALKAERSEGIYLWGAGKYGIPLAKYLRIRDVKILGIIDNKLNGCQIENFDIISLNEVYSRSKIFVAVSDEDANKEIMKQIKNYSKRIYAVGYKHLYKEYMEKYL